MVNPKGQHEDISYLNQFNIYDLPDAVLPQQPVTLKQAQSMSSGGRSDAVLTVNASSGNSIDMITAGTVIINMNAILTGFTPAVLPTVDGQKVLLIFVKTGTLYTATPNGARIRGGLDVIVPSPLLNATINTRDYLQLIWNNTDQTYDVLANPRRYP